MGTPPRGTIIRPDELMSEVPIEIQKSVLTHLVAIYDARPDQVGTGFLAFWNGKHHLITAKHTLFGKCFDEDPFAKQVHLGGDLVTLGEISQSPIADDPKLDVAIVIVKGFEKDRILPYTALQVGVPPPKVISVIGFLVRDFRRSRTDATLRPKPYCFTNLSVDIAPAYVGVQYTKRATTTSTGKKALAPIPRGLSGTAMLSTSSLLLKEIKIHGIFTDERLEHGHVFGAHVDALPMLMKSLSP